MINKYVRGSIWWTELARDGITTHVQYGRRPCIVISNDTNNVHSPTVNVIPCTTSRDKLDVIHPSFKLNGETNYALVEQIRTVDATGLFRYCGTLTGEEFEAIENSLKQQLGLHIQDTDSEIILQLKELSKTLDNIEKMKTEQVKKDVEKDKELKIVIDNVNKKIRQYSGMNAVEKFNAKYKVDEPPKSESRSEGHKRINKWTEENITQLLKDSEVLSTEEIMSKWHLKDKKTVQTYVGKFKRARAQRAALLAARDNHSTAYSC